MKEACICKHPTVDLRSLAVFDATGLLAAPFTVRLYHAVEERYCKVCGITLSHLIPRVGELSAVTAVMRACDPLKLNGAEIRFLRRSLNRKAKDFAEEIAISPEQLSRFENDKVPISESYEKLLRAAVCLGHFELTSEVGVHPNLLFSMKIVSARSADRPLEFDLFYGHRPKRKAVVNGESEAEDSIWQGAVHR